MRILKVKTSVIVRWVLLVPVIPMSAFCTLMGIVGLGFGAGPFMLGYVLAFPAFLLNLISPKWGIIGATLLIILDYAPRAILNWPTVNPLVLLNAKVDGMLVAIFGLTLASGITFRLIEKQTEAHHTD